MTMSGRPRRGQQNRQPNSAPMAPPRSAAQIREFVYLDQTSVQSILASLIGAIPTEITTNSSHSDEAEIAAGIEASVPLTARAELSSRFTSTVASSQQVGSRAVAESLFRSFYSEIEDKLVVSLTADGPIPVEKLSRGTLVEFTIELVSDPVYRFNSTMGVLSDLAADYPPLAADPTTAMLLRESEVVNKVLEGMLVGLIPLKSPVLNLQLVEIDGAQHLAPTAFSVESHSAPKPFSIVGVTEQEKYWRDVRRVLFNNGEFKLLGRIARPGIQDSWTPVKLTEVMREIAPQFPDAITKVGLTGYATPINRREAENAQALQNAIIALVEELSIQGSEPDPEEVAAFAKSKSDLAGSLVMQRQAFEEAIEWMIAKGAIISDPEDLRAIRIRLSREANLSSSSVATAITDFDSPSPGEVQEPEALIDLEVIAIYW